MSLELLLSTVIFWGTYAAILTTRVERSLDAIIGGTSVFVIGPFFVFRNGLQA